MKKKVIIIESPNKIHTISLFAPTCKVLATKGHFRDLSPTDISIDMNTYEGKFSFTSDYAKNMALSMKRECHGAIVYIASDPDREGYAIGKMVYNEIHSVALEVFRAEFYEITQKGIEEGLAAAVPFLQTNLNTYEAFLGRRLGDRLIGWIMSPVVKKAIMKHIDPKKEGAAVGRVQSPAVRLVVEKEREIESFIALPVNKKVYHKIFSECIIGGVVAKAIFDEDFIERAEAERVADRIKSYTSGTIVKVETKTLSEKALPPLITTDLIDNGIRILESDGEAVMQIAQKLFEKGLITYMRVDSTRLSNEFIDNLPPVFNSSFPSLHQKNQHKSKLSQAEAHEAIRPSNESFEYILNFKEGILRAISAICTNNALSSDEEKILRLIYARAIASQSVDSQSKSQKIAVDIGGIEMTINNSFLVAAGHKEILFAISGIKYKTGLELCTAVGDVFDIRHIGVETKSRPAPRRYDEGALTKELEKKGIGRPSTYTSYVKSIRKNGFVVIDEKKKLAPTKKSFFFIDYLLAEYAWVIDYQLTAEMELFLDAIQDGRKTSFDFCKMLHGKMGELPWSASSTPPTAAQVSLMEKLSFQTGIKITSDAIESVGSAKKWIEVSMKLADKIGSGTAPSESQILFAQRISSALEVNIDKEIQDSKLLSNFINKYKDKYFTFKKTGEKSKKSKTNVPINSNDKSTGAATDRQVEFARAIARKMLIDIDESIFNSFETTSIWIKENKAILDENT